MTGTDGRCFSFARAATRWPLARCWPASSYHRRGERPRGVRGRELRVQVVLPARARSGPATARLLRGAQLETAINWGIAGFVWLIIGLLLAALLRRAGGAAVGGIGETPSSSLHADSRVGKPFFPILSLAGLLHRAAPRTDRGSARYGARDIAAVASARAEVESPQTERRRDGRSARRHGSHHRGDVQQ